MAYRVRLGRMDDTGKDARFQMHVRNVHMDCIKQRWRHLDYTEGHLLIWMMYVSPDKTWHMKVSFSHHLREPHNSIKPFKMFIYLYFKLLNLWFFFPITNSSKIAARFPRRPCLLLISVRTDHTRRERHVWCSVLLYTLLAPAPPPYIPIFNFPTPMPSRKRSALLLFICTKDWECLRTASASS